MVKEVVCKICGHGECCREGVEADLWEVGRILEESLDIPRPWFKYIGRDKTFPSGYKFSTVLKNRRCVFQNEQNHCVIYEIRPRFCEEFPLEGGKKAPYYHRLCHYGKKKKNMELPRVKARGSLKATCPSGHRPSAPEGRGFRSRGIKKRGQK